MTAPPTPPQSIDTESQISSQPPVSRSFGEFCQGWIRRLGISPSQGGDDPGGPRVKRIEDYPQGYPRFAGLVGNDAAFTLSRRFSVARARLLLKKQDRVAQLEERLEEIDRNEPRKLFLGSMRRDQNAEREAVLQELDAALADYDELLERNARILHLPTAKKRHKESLLNWIENTGSISRQETSFLEERDLCSTGKVGDDGLSTIEQLVERSFIGFLNLFRLAPPSTVSQDSNVFVFNHGMLKVITRLLITWIIVVLLLVPVIVIRLFSSPAFQIACILIASGLFLLVLSTVVNAKTTEIFIAGPTYAAILVAFIANDIGGK